MIFLYIIGYVIIGFFIIRYALRKNEDKETTIIDLISLVLLWPIVLALVIYDVLNEIVIKF